MLSLPLVVFIALAGLLGVFWQNSLGVRERANRAAQEACERMQLQFLDGTVAFARLSLARDAGRLTLRRTYVFDYTASSIDRRQGFVTLLGQRIEAIGFAPDEDQRARIAPTAPTTDDPKVLNIEDFRQRRKNSPPLDGTRGPDHSSRDQGHDGW